MLNRIIVLEALGITIQGKSLWNPNLIAFFYVKDEELFGEFNGLHLNKVINLSFQYIEALNKLDFCDHLIKFSSFYLEIDLIHIRLLIINKLIV
jgi:hypothetical protein